MKKYIILRDLNRSAAGSGTRGASPENFGPGTRSLQGLGRDNLPAPEIETASLSAGDVENAARDPEVKGFGEVMPAAGQLKRRGGRQTR